jgi:catechol 2,3-dioxygenase-like lactoylglutathione lyase family enzyme
VKARPLIYVSDVERSIEFYGLLGLDPVDRRTGKLVELRGENITIALHRAASPPGSPAKPRVLLTFEADRPIH